VNLQKAPLLIIRAERGYIGCGYFDRKMLEKAGDCAVLVAGVKSFRDMMRARPSYVSKAARRLGAKPSMKCSQILDLFI
jgi:uncharacterized protein YunC (DUF1805 family)